MKKILALAIVGTMTFICCDDDSRLCSTDEFSPNKYKFFLPYDENENIIFLDENGNSDTLQIEKYELPASGYSSRDCFQPSESINVEMNLNYNSGSNCKINYHCTLSRVPPYLVVRSSFCNFNASYEGIVLGSEDGTIRDIDNYEFEQNEYDKVIKLEFMENESGIEEIVLAKDIGFVYLKIGGSIRKPVN